MAEDMSNTERRIGPVGRRPQLPEGYASFVDRFKEYENPKLVNRLTTLYRDMASLLNRSGQPGNEFKMRINDRWSVIMSEVIRKDLLEGLNSGNPKVIAALAFYVWEKSRGNLPLEAIPKNPLQNPKLSKHQREEYGNRALRLMTDMEDFVSQTEQRRFVINDTTRSDWEMILSSKSGEETAVVAEAEAYLHEKGETASS